MHMCVCACVRAHTCVLMRVCMRTCVHAHSCVCVCMCVHVQLHACTVACMYMCMHVHACACACMWVPVGVWMRVSYYTGDHQNLFVIFLMYGYVSLSANN